MSPLTPLHYLLLIGLILSFIIGLILSLRSKSPFSITVTIAGILTMIGYFLWVTINSVVYQVEITNVSNQRFYQTEQILIKGTVKNTGNYPIKNVVAIIKMSNQAEANTQKANQFSQSTVFDELFEGDDPQYKRQNIIEKHLVADSLNPGSAKTFRIMMDYPPYFNKADFQVIGQVD